MSFPLVELGKHFAHSRSDWVRGLFAYPLKCIGFICVGVFVYVFVKSVVDWGRLYGRHARSMNSVYWDGPRGSVCLASTGPPLPTPSRRRSVVHPVLPGLHLDASVRKPDRGRFATRVALALSSANGRPHALRIAGEKCAVPFSSRESKANHWLSSTVQAARTGQWKRALQPTQRPSFLDVRCSRAGCALLFRHAILPKIFRQSQLRAETSSAIAFLTMMAASLRCLPSVSTPVPSSMT